MRHLPASSRSFSLRPPHLILSTHPLPSQVSLNYHMKCEQYTHSATRSFFNFNGTAGGAAARWAKTACFLELGQPVCLRVAKGPGRS